MIGKIKAFIPVTLSEIRSERLKFEVYAGENGIECGRDESGYYDDSEGAKAAWETWKFLVFKGRKFQGNLQASHVLQEKAISVIEGMSSDLGCCAFSCKTDVVKEINFDGVKVRLCGNCQKKLTASLAG